MKVKDLIERLSKADPEAELSFQMADGCCGDQEYLELYDADFEEYKMYNKAGELVRPKDLPNGIFIFSFNAPWFMDTCITSGQAKSAAKAHKDRVKAHRDGKKDTP